MGLTLNFMALFQTAWKITINTLIVISELEWAFLVNVDLLELSSTIKMDGIHTLTDCKSMNFQC